MSDTPRKELPQAATCLPWRVGTKVGRTIYCDNKLIGVMDKVQDAEFVVAATVAAYDLEREVRRLEVENAILRKSSNDEFPYNPMNHQEQIAELQREKESLTQQLADHENCVVREKERIEALEQALAVKIQDLTATQQRFEAETQLTDRLTRELSSRAATSQALAYRANTADERISELYQCIGELREALAASATLVCDGNCPAAVMEGPHSGLCQQIAKLLAIPQAVEPQP